jgi:two-component system nitrogen regulation response regulator GlnG
MSETPSRVWLVEDDPSLQWVMREALREAAVETRVLEDAESLAVALERETPDLILLDVRLPGEDGLTALRRLRRRHPDLPVIVTTAHADLDTAVSAYGGGAFEYLPKPFDVDEFTALVQRALRERGTTQPAQAGEVAGPARLIGESPGMQAVFRTIGRLSRSDMSVLVTGESGTGKELVARALHEHGPRAGGPFVALNTAAIPRDLLESELFGHERGAFTGAVGRRHGRFQQAAGGTLFLDEIGDMPLELQTRLLRVLAEREFYPVGGREPVRADVRVIAATHQDLDALVRSGRFREDLYHRLNVVAIHLPPLRERRQDIPRLLEHFLAEAAAETGLPRRRLATSAMRRLQTHDWPGNVRELRNLCRRLTVMSPTERVEAADLPAELGAGTPATGPDWETAFRRWLALELAAGRTGLGEAARRRLDRLLVQAALEHTTGHRQKAAAILGWGRNTLTRKLQEMAATSGAGPRGRRD